MGRAREREGGLGTPEFYLVEGFSETVSKKKDSLSPVLLLEERDGSGGSDEETVGSLR